jgi:UDP-arabinose 4-epimerase
VAAVERTLGYTLSVKFGPRRPGDPPNLVASAVQARDQLGWTPELSQIDFIVNTALSWFISRQTSIPILKQNC